jgi:hypothetical protein
MAYDRADWHYGSDFPNDVPDENGGTHIGMFLAWAIINNWHFDTSITNLHFWCVFSYV